MAFSQINLRTREKNSLKLGYFSKKTNAWDNFLCPYLSFSACRENKTLIQENFMDIVNEILIQPIENEFKDLKGNTKLVRFYRKAILIVNLLIKLVLFIRTLL